MRGADVTQAALGLGRCREAKTQEGKHQHALPWPETALWL
jgi:hypothetical protein